MVMLLMTAICHVFSRLLRFYFVTVQPSAGSSAAYRTWWIVASDQRLYKSHGNNLILPEEAQEVKEEVFSRMSTDDYSESSGSSCPPTLHLHWNGSETYQLTMLLPNALWESEFSHNIPNKHRQFKTFQPSQLAFVCAIWHSHNAHVFQIPPSCLFFQFLTF